MRFYLTTPIYYVNAAPHLGHAYTTLLADATARAHRLLGEDVMFLTGTDEHGQKIERSARKAGVEPRAFVDAIAAQFQQLFGELGVSNDDFIRTSEARHRRAVEAIWRVVAARGDLYKATYSGWYCTTDEIYVPETQLLDGRRCPNCGGAVEWLEEENIKFRLSSYQQPLLDLYRRQPDFVVPQARYNEVLAFIERGLEDLSVSRTSFTWGIPVPDEPGHVVYVWFDALTNYLTAVGYGDPAPDAQARLARYWPADVHLIGKEIVRQHAVYWPAFLMSAGLPLPRRIVSHGWWTMEGAKMSKSLGNVVRPAPYVAAYGLDAFRYFVLREMVLGADAAFTDEAFHARYTADLANDLGNLLSRTATMIERYCGGAVPAPAWRDEADDSIENEARRTIAEAVEAACGFEFSRALSATWRLISEANRFLVAREPWGLAKDPASRAKLDATLYRAADVLRIVAMLVEPAMPAAAASMRQTLGVPLESWTTLAPNTLAAGTRVTPPQPLFPRKDSPVSDQSPEQPSAPAAPPAPAPAVPALQPATEPVAAASKPAEVVAAAPEGPARISIEQFMSVELRVARVLAAERVPKSKKLVKMSVDLGSETRTLVAGIAEAYTPEALVGRTVIVVANLQPAKLMGIESNGMVLAASPDGGLPQLVAFDEPVPAPGTRVR
jgi:methionyl-tRNA synthetase